MRILIVGSTGVLGRRIVPSLVDAGHDVIGTTRKVDRVGALSRAGAEPVVVDAFDGDALERVTRDARPDVLLHLLTDLSEGNPDANARLRIFGTRNVVAAARRAGVERLVVESIAWAYEPGDTPADEAVPLDLAAGPPRSRTIEGVKALEDAAAVIPHTVILRFGVLYGADTWYCRDGLIGAKLRRGEAVASRGITSFVHVDDAAGALVQAVEWPSGTVNIVDDEPASGVEWSPLLAATIDASAPRELLPAQPFERGADNRRARGERGWRPHFGSWRAGFPATRLTPGASG